MEIGWVTQRGKSHWLTHYDDDLQFIYKAIKEKNNNNIIREILTPIGLISDHLSITLEFCAYYSNLFNNDISFRPHFDITPGSILGSSQMVDLGCTVSNQ